MNINQELIGISSDGKIFDLTIKMKEKVGDISEYLRKEALKTALIEKMDKNFYIAKQNGRTATAQILEELSFSTYFRLSENKDTCTFAWVEQDTSIFHTLKAKMPEDMKLVIMKSFSNEIYLIALSMKDGNIYKLPLTNVHTHGQICMGDESYYSSSDSEFEKFAKVVEVFNKTPWNDDLNGASKQADKDALWKWNLDDESFIKMPENWERHCIKLSNDNFNEMARFILEREGYVFNKTPVPEVVIDENEEGLEWPS